MSRDSTQLLRAVRSGDTDAEPYLIQLVYDELRGIAGRIIRENPRATIQATELIHEAWLRLVDFEDEPERVHGLRHYRRIAARAMRHVLVDRARARRTAKRGGNAEAIALDEDLLESPGSANGADAALAVHEGLERLAACDPELAQVVELRYYGGLGMTEIAETLQISERSAHRRWRLARAWWLEQYGDRTGPALGS